MTVQTFYKEHLSHGMLNDSPLFPTEPPPSRRKELLPTLKVQKSAHPREERSQGETSTLPFLNSEDRYVEEETTAGPEQRSLALRELLGWHSIAQQTHAEQRRLSTQNSPSEPGDGWVGLLLSRAAVPLISWCCIKTLVILLARALCGLRVPRSPTRDQTPGPCSGSAES